MPQSCASFVRNTARGKPTGQRHILALGRLLPSLRGTPLKADMRWAREGRPMVFAGAIRINGAGLLLSANCGVVHQQKQRLLPQFSRSSVMSRGSDLTSLDALDDVSQYSVGAASYSDLLALAYDQPIKKFDFRAPTLLHILAHRRPLFGRGALALPEALLIAGAHRRFIAFSRARNHLGGQVVDLLKLVAQRLPNTDRFAANARREMTERIIVQHLAAGQAGAGGDPICHRVGHQLRPALAPEISGHLGAICISD